MLQDNINWRNYNSCVVIYINRLRESCYVLTTQFNIYIYKINKNRYNVVIHTYVYNVV